MAAWFPAVADCCLSTLNDTKINLSWRGIRRMWGDTGEEEGDKRQQGRRNGRTFKEKDKSLPHPLSSAICFWFFFFFLTSQSRTLHLSLPISQISHMQMKRRDMQVLSSLYPGVITLKKKNCFCVKVDVQMYTQTFPRCPDVTQCCTRDPINPYVHLNPSLVHLSTYTNT